MNEGMDKERKLLCHRALYRGSNAGSKTWIDSSFLVRMFSYVGASVKRLAKNRPRYITL